MHVRAASVRTEELKDVATVDEFAAFLRVDPRTLRAELNAGRVPGAIRCGRSWRIATRAYLDTLAAPAMSRRPE